MSDTMLRHTETVTIAMDAQSIGRLFAESPCDIQARFLEQMSSAMDGYDYHAQMKMMAQEISITELPSVAMKVRVMAEYLEHELRQSREIIERM